MHKFTFGSLAAVAAVTLVAGLGWSPALASATSGSPAGSSAAVGQRSAVRAAGRHASVSASCPKLASATQATCMVIGRSSGIHPDTPAGYGPADLRSAYGLAALASGARQTVAVITPYDEATAAADLTAYRSTYGLPPCTSTDGCFSQVNQTATPPQPPPAGTSWPVTTDTALDMISAVCPNCHLLLVQANTPAITDLGAAVNVAAAQGANVIEIGWDVTEFSGETSDDTKYFTHKGIAIIVASAESTTTGGYGYGDIGYPAASPDVTAVGGTTLSQDSSDTPRGWSETAWQQTGSGCSMYEKAPSWQAQPSGDPPLCTGGMRALNDLAADADPNTGVAVENASAWYDEGGTGVAAAIVAGIYALAGPAGSSDNPAAYPYEHPGGSYGTPGNKYPFYEGLNDINSGFNASGTCTPAYLCTAGYGYDGPTGLGSPEGSVSFNPAGGATGSIRSAGVYSMCMDDSGDGTTDNTKIDIYKCGYLDSQNWTLESDGSLQINGKCADLVSGGTANNTLVQLFTCNTLAVNQDWQAESNGELINPYSGRCLSDPNASTTNGTQLQIYDCSDYPQQRWIPPYVVPASSGEITSGISSGLCVNDENGTTSNGNVIRIYGCLGDDAEEWTIEHGGDIRLNEDSSQCIDILDYGTTVGSLIQLYSCNDGASQQWVTRSDGSLLNPASGLCLEDPKSGPSGTRLDIDTCSGASDELWPLPPL